MRKWKQRQPEEPYQLRDVKIWMEIVGLIVAVVAIVFMSSIAVNAYQFAFKCDFEAPYKCEATHGLGVAIPPLALIAVWAETDKGEK